MLLNTPHVQELINQTLWPDHPLGRPLTGTPKTLDGMRRETLVAFMRRNYVASNTVLAVAETAHDRGRVEVAVRDEHARPGETPRDLLGADAC